MTRYVKIPLKAIGQEDIEDPSGEYEPTTEFVAEVLVLIGDEVEVEAVHTGDRFTVKVEDTVAHEGMWL